MQLCVCGGGSVSDAPAQLVCGGQRTSSGTPLSPSHMWALRTKRSSSVKSYLVRFNFCTFNFPLSVSNRRALTGAGGHEITSTEKTEHSPNSSCALSYLASLSIPAHGITDLIFCCHVASPFPECHKK